VPRTRAGRPRWLLEELEVPYELVRLDPAHGDNKKADYLELNPTGHVPTLVDGDVVLFESAAICLYLADKYPEKGMAPAIGARERGAYLQWMVHAVADIDSPISGVDRHTNRLPPEQRIPAVIELERRRFQANVAALRRALAGRPYVLGETFSAADVMVASSLGWGKLLGLLAEEPALEEYVRRCVSRPAAKRSRAD